MRRTADGQDEAMVVLVIVVFLLAFAGVAYGVYSRRGSNINAHPQGEESSSAPGAATDSAMSTHEDPTQGSFGTR